MGIVVNSSSDTARPLLRLLGLIASVVVFAGLWSGDQKIQKEIAANRAKSRPVYAGPSVMQHFPIFPRRAATQMAYQTSAPVSWSVNQIPSGQYRLSDNQGNYGTLVWENRDLTNRKLDSRFGLHPSHKTLATQFRFSEMRLKPIQSVSASSLITR